MADAAPPPALRTPPHSVEAEQAVLGAVLQDNAAVDACGALLQSADFYRHEHRLVWDAVHALVMKGKPADIVTVFEAMAAAGTAKDAGGLQALNALAMGVATARNAAAYAAVVRRRALARRLIAISDNCAARAFRLQADTQAELDAVIDGTVLELTALQKGAAEDDPVPLGELVPAWIDELNQRAEGISDAMSLGLADVDRALDGGGRRGELHVLGARPSMGKSAFTLGVMRAVAAAGPVLVCSLEDSAGMLLSRQVAAVGRVNLATVRNPQRAPESLWTSVLDAVDALKDLPLYIDDRAGLSLAQVRRKATFVKRKAGDLLLVVVDYLQLMEDEGENRADELASLARGLKRVAKDLGCMVLLLSQLNRKADETNAPPRLDHLEGSGGIEAAADVIGLLWRKSRRDKKADKHSAQVEFAKNKNGPTGTVELWFDGATQRFENAQQGEQHDGQ